MILITGGMYQGKQEFAKEKFNLKDTEIFNFYENNKLDEGNYKAMYGCENQVRNMVKMGKTPDEILEFWSNPCYEDCILIFNDVSMGIVPLDKEERTFREATGKVATCLAGKAENVYRIFCGIPMTLK